MCFHHSGPNWEPSGDAVQNFSMKRAAVVLENPEERPIQQGPLRLAHPTASATIGRGFEAADRLVATGLSSPRIWAFARQVSDTCRPGP